MSLQTGAQRDTPIRDGCKLFVYKDCIYRGILQSPVECADSKETYPAYDGLIVFLNLLNHMVMDHEIRWRVKYDGQ